MKIGDKYKGLVYLLAIVVVVPLATYVLALDKTVSAWTGYRRDAALLEELRYKDAVSADNTRDSVEADDAGGEGMILGELIGAAERSEAVMDMYRPYAAVNEAGLNVQTTELVLVGGYVPIVKFIEHVEAKMPSVKVISVNFKATVSRRTKLKQLKASVIIQQILQ